MQTKHLFRYETEPESALPSGSLLTVVFTLQEDLALRLADILPSLNPKVRQRAAFPAAPVEAAAV